jgi:hypothetical protein
MILSAPSTQESARIIASWSSTLACARLPRIRVLLCEKCYAGLLARKSSRLHTYLGGPDRDFPGEFLYHP